MSAAPDSERTWKLTDVKFDAARPSLKERLVVARTKLLMHPDYTWIMDEMSAIAQALQEQADEMRAWKGEDSRPKFRTDEWADALAPRNEAPGREKEST